MKIYKKILLTLFLVLFMTAPVMGTNEIIFLRSGVRNLGTPGIIGDVSPDVATFTKVTIESDSAQLLDLNPTHTGSAQIIDISPENIISTAAAHWDGINISGDNLDPTAVDVILHGMCIDFSGVDITYSPHMDNLCLHAIEGQNAIHIDDGKIRHDLTTGTDAGAEYTGYDIIIDGTNLNAASTMHMFDVAVSNGAPSGDVYAIGTHANVNPLIQVIGSYSTPSQTEFAGRKISGGTTWADGIDFVTTAAEVFFRNSDEIYVGVDSAATQFSEIEVIMNTNATRSINPTFWYSTSSTTWTQFYPSDDTNGFQKSGIIRWTLGDISASWTNDGDPGVGETTAGYWIKIIRTVAADPGVPKITTAKTGTVVNYSWDKDGDVSVNTIAINSEYDTIYVDAGAMFGCTTSGAESGTNEYGTNDMEFDYFAFDGGATEERVQFKLKMPENWDLGTINVKFDWSSATSSSQDDTCQWGIKGQAYSDSAVIDVAFGDAGEVIGDVLLEDNGTDMQITAASPDVTVGGTPALGDLILFEIWRDTSVDNMTEDAWLFGITIQYNKSGAVPAW